MRKEQLEEEVKTGLIEGERTGKRLRERGRKRMANKSEAMME